MLILHVLFSSRIAGSERYCIDLANRQATAGHEVHVAGTPSSPLIGALSSRIRYHRIGWFLRPLQVRRLVDRLAPDISHGHLSAACKALGRLARHHQTVATLHVGYKAHQHSRLSGLICVNRAQANRLDGYRGMARTIPNWLPQAPAEATGPGLREELGLADNVFLVGAVGRLHASKGMDVLISAFRAFAPERAALVIVGEGPQRAELDRLRAGDPRIHLLGYRANVQECLPDLDLFVSPSREESFGLAIIEAMSTGVPIIATAAEGPGEILRDQPVALVPVGAIEPLVAELHAVHRKYLAGDLARIGYDLSLFDPESRVVNIGEFYNQVFEAGRWTPARPDMPRMAVAT